MTSFVKEPGSPPLAADLAQYEYFLWDFQNIAENMRTVWNAPDSPYKAAIAEKRAEVVETCRQLIVMLTKDEPAYVHAEMKRRDAARRAAQ